MSEKVYFFKGFCLSGGSRVVPKLGLDSSAATNFELFVKCVSIWVLDSSIATND